MANAGAIDTSNFPTPGQNSSGRERHDGLLSPKTKEWLAKQNNKLARGERLTLMDAGAKELIEAGFAAIENGPVVSPSLSNLSIGQQSPLGIDQICQPDHMMRGLALRVWAQFVTSNGA
ncbi:uncharacterized protein LTR77_000894 [Saxophila tyrrhenica]|uniref:Uncharacterized protein n=1 Tax=Saxophila tyrrhenica TaxID=1690608 RepID=A0AAV9PPB3_9PEZI|nr:hypothetical protein LTR77_000894 [Saxophila tyrrhenica]